MKTKFSIVFCFLFVTTGFAQDSIFNRLASNNLKTFSYSNNSFNGEGWDFIKNEVAEATNVLVGEDHFSNEIPKFINAIASSTKFDNFYIEVDPYSTAILKKSILKYSKQERERFNSEFSDLFSFYALKPEYELLCNIVESGVNLLGSDQIVMYADRLIFQDIAKRSSNEKAKEIYNYISKQSKLHLEAFYLNPQLPMYFMTSEFGLQLEKLDALELSTKEDLILKDMQRSVIIYKERSHKKRVNLIMNQLMKDYPIWNHNRTLFKYGANHLTRGESFLANFDIGNLVANITESNYQESYHIMIVGESGMLGSPFKTFPPNPIDSETGFYLKHLKPFFTITEGKEWHVFDLKPLQKEIEKNHLSVSNLNLLRTIKGFDTLVIIPEVTAAKF